MLMTRGWPDLWELFRKTLEQIVWMMYDWPGQRNFPAKPWAKNR